MRTLVISDVHANLPALDAVLESAGRFSRVWCLGDLVGYGPYPNECIERVRSLPNLTCIKGNHDAAILGEIDMRTFNFEARSSINWLTNVLSESNRVWLSNLEEYLVVDSTTLVHGSPRDPIWEYVFDKNTARENMDYFDTQVCLVGHTHVPSIYYMEKDAPTSTHFSSMKEGNLFQISQKCIINPGSVGQPRDRDPRAAYMIYNSKNKTWTYYRVSYNVKEVQKRILDAGLPSLHADRLQMGR